MILAILIGILLIAVSVMVLISGADQGNISEVALGAGLIAAIGIFLLAGAVILYRCVGNTNAFKRDDSVEISYSIMIDDRMEPLTDIQFLKEQLLKETPGSEILVELCPEYFGLKSWKFCNVNGLYVSFVQIHKKDKYIQYFTMPREDVEEAVKEFSEVFADHKAVDTSKLISMSRYKAVLEYYKLQ